MSDHVRTGTTDSKGTSKGFRGIAERLERQAATQGIPMEKDPGKAQHMIKTDIRDSVPPQLYALMAAVVNAAEGRPMTDSGGVMSQNSHTRTDKNKV